MSVVSVVKKTLGLIFILYGLLTIPSGISILGYEWAWGIGRIIGALIFVVAGLYLIEVWPFEKEEEEEEEDVKALNLEEEEEQE